MNGLIQGNNVAIAFNKNGYVPFFCASDLTATMNTDVLPTRTPGAGHWGKNAYQKLSYTISLSGLSIVNQQSDANFTVFDTLDNWLGFTNLQFRIAWYDDQGNIRCLQGSGVISGIDMNATPANLAKATISIVGDGELKYFIGLIPCVALITGITVTGQTGASGTVTVTYTYTGSPFKVKWRLNGSGAYIYAMIGVAIVIPNLVNGNYSIEIIPSCQNGYDADVSTSQVFIVTHALTCSATCSAISTSGGAITPTFTGTPSTWKYSFDGGPYTTVPIATTSISTAGLSVGAHTVSVIPTCSNAVDGTGNSASFTVSVSPTASLINVTLFSLTAPDNVINVFVNGVLNASLSGSGSSSSSFTAPIGATVLGRLNINNNSGQNGTLTTVDNTTSTTINTQSHAVPGVLAFSFTANGDTFTIGGSIL